MDRLELTYTDADGTRLGVKRAFSLDLAYGDDENDFELRLAETDSVPLHGYVYVDGTELGGVVDCHGADATGDVPVSTWSGRTWTGILARSVVVPTGDHYVMSGDAHAAMAALVAAQGLGGVFSVPSAPSGFQLSYQVPRFADAYSAMRGALASVGARLGVERRNGTTWLSAVPSVAHHATGRGSVSYVLSDDTRPVNHLVCAGSGELSQRVVVHLYANESGSVSQTQSLFGVDEVAELYDFPGADAEQLVEYGTELLARYQADARYARVSDLSSPGFAVGDTVNFLVRATGTAMSAPVTKAIVSVGTASVPSYTYQLGDLSPVTT